MTVRTHLQNMQSLSLMLSLIALPFSSACNKTQPAAAPQPAPAPQPAAPPSGTSAPVVKAKIIRPGVKIDMPGTERIDPNAAVCTFLCFYLSNAQSVELSGKLETNDQAANDQRMGQALMGAYTMGNACAAECARDGREKGCGVLDNNYALCMHGNVPQLEGTVCALSTLEQASQCCQEGNLTGGICKIAHVKTYEEFKKALPQLGDFVHAGKTTKI
jgi:hypothetical protein